MGFVVIICEAAEENTNHEFINRPTQVSGFESERSPQDSQIGDVVPLSGLLQLNSSIPVN